MQKTTKVNQDLHMSELFLMNFIVLRDANENLLFNHYGRQHDRLSQRYFKLREEQAYLKLQKHVIKLQYELSRSTPISPVVTTSEKVD